MPGCLKMLKTQQSLALLELDWNYRRSKSRRAFVAKRCPRTIGSVGEVRPERSPALSPRALAASPDLLSTDESMRPTRSPARHFACGAAVYRTAVTEKLAAGLSLQRIWRDLVEEYGSGAQAPRRRRVPLVRKDESISSAER